MLWATSLNLTREIQMSTHNLQSKQRRKSEKETESDALIPAKGKGYTQLGQLSQTDADTVPHSGPVSLT